MRENEESCNEVVDERQPDAKEIGETTEQQQGTYCPYCMSQNCPMMAQAGMQSMGGMKPIKQWNTPNWGNMQGEYPYMGYGMQPSYFSDVWTQSQPSCMQNCMQDMYQAGYPVHTYGPGIGNVPNQYMYGLNQTKIIDRDNSSYGSCCNPYGLGRY